MIMAKIGLIDVDGGKTFPNIPLMKISAWHKSKGDQVLWYSPIEGHFDDVYMSKVFSFTPDYDYVVDTERVHRGGLDTALKWLMARRYIIRKWTRNSQRR